MRHSTERILTTHVGSLPELASLDRAAPDYSRRLKQSVAAVVAKQRELGIDFINEGCGFGGRAHPQIAWAKLRALTEGARAASRALGFSGSDEP